MSANADRTDWLAFCQFVKSVKGVRYYLGEEGVKQYLKGMEENLGIEEGTLFHLKNRDKFIEYIKFCSNWANKKYLNHIQSELDLITVTKVAKQLQFDSRTIKNKFHNDVIEIRGRDYLKRKILYPFISKNTHKYINGKKSPCKYDRLPEYLTINDCAKMKGLENGRQFRRSYVDKYIKKDHKVLDGVEVLEIGSTVRIEKASFELWIKSEGEKAT